MSDVQRYETCAIGLNNIALKNAIQKADTGPLVHYSDYAKLAAECKRYREALEKLARLGNEPLWGNSIGNEIAQEALGVKK